MAHASAAARRLAAPHSTHRVPLRPILAGNGGRHGRFAAVVGGRRVHVKVEGADPAGVRDRRKAPERVVAEEDARPAPAAALPRKRPVEDERVGVREHGRARLEARVVRSDHRRRRHHRNGKGAPVAAKLPLAAVRHFLHRKRRRALAHFGLLRRAGLRVPQRHVERVFDLKARQNLEEVHALLDVQARHLHQRGQGVGVQRCHHRHHHRRRALRERKGGKGVTKRNRAGRFFAAAGAAERTIICCGATITGCCV